MRKDSLAEILVLAYTPWDEDFYNILRFGLPAPRHFYAFPSYFGRHEDFTISRPPIEPRPARGRRGRPWSFAQRLFRRCAKLIRIVAAGPRLAAQIRRRNRRGRPCLKIGTARARNLSSPATKSLRGSRGPEAGVRGIPSPFINLDERGRDTPHASLLPLCRKT
jgi:hypothetical protein